MNTSASDLFGQARHRWGRMAGAQRWLAGGLIAVFALATGLALYLNRTEWVVLVSQADPRDAAAIVGRLQELKVPYRPVGDGYTITVPKADQYTAKLALAQAGLPKGGSVGLELFDEVKFGSTDFDRRVNYLRAQQGELERALLRINEVEYASVKLAIPERTVFVRDQEPVTAAVMLQVRTGRKLTADQVLGIVNFVSGSVQGLNPERVQVVDQSGRLLSSGLNVAPGLEAAESDQLQRQMTMQRELETRVQSLLEPIFGAGNVVARINLELSMDSSRIESQTVTDGAPRNTEVVRETATGGVTGTGGDMGTGDGGAPPVYQGQEGALANSGDQWRTRTTTNYELSQRKEITLVVPGSVKRISVGIAVNRPDLSFEQIRQIQETVAGATGAEIAAISVATMQFSQGMTALPEIVEPSGFPIDPLVVGGGAAGLLLLLGYLFTSRRKQNVVQEPMIPLGTSLGDAGSTLDVALGMNEEPPLEGRRGNLDEAAAPVDGQTARQRLEVVMKHRPKRQLVVDGQPIDNELIQHTDEVINGNPEAGAEVLRQWLKGGTTA